MRFLFVASGRNVPSTRFRIEPYIPLLQQRGHRCDMAYSYPEKYDYFPRIGWRASQLLKRSVRRWHALQASWRDYDCIVIEREVFDDDSSFIEQKLRRCTNRLVLDVDDGIHLLHPEKFSTIAQLCDAAIAGNQFLAQVLQPLCPQVITIPTCVRLADYPQRPREQPTVIPTVGWIGTTGNVAFLDVCAAPLREVAKETSFRLLVVAPSDQHLRSLDLANVNVEFRSWNPETEVADLQTMSLGLMPLPEGQPWMKFKCGLKLIQYLAVGIPGIASPIGVNEEILTSGTVGVAATDPAQWIDGLRLLLSDPEKRLAWGANGRRLVETHYSVEANIDRFEAILKGTHVSL